MNTLFDLAILCRVAADLACAMGGHLAASADGRGQP